MSQSCDLYLLASCIADRIGVRDLVLPIGNALINSFDIDNFNKLVADSIWMQLSNENWIRVDGDLSLIAQYLSEQVADCEYISLLHRNQTRRILYKFSGGAKGCDFKEELIIRIAEVYTAVSILPRPDNDRLLITI